MRSASVVVKLEIPEHHLKDFVQYMRDFEQREPKNIHFAMIADIPWMSTVDLVELLRTIYPPLPEEMVLLRGRANA